MNDENTQDPSQEEPVAEELAEEIPEDTDGVVVPFSPVFHPAPTPDISRLDARTRKDMRKAKRQFAWLAGLAALGVAFLLELFFVWTEVGNYFYDHATKIVLFQPGVRKATRNRLGTGDVQLTLRWEGTNDLDLHVIDPFGNHVFFGDRQVPSNGRLDLDMNAGWQPWSSSGIENVYWPYGAAPAGTYKVMVHHYRRNGGPDNQPFTVRILNRGGVKTVQGSSLYVLPPYYERWTQQVEGLDPVNQTKPVEVARFTVLPSPLRKPWLTWDFWAAVAISMLWFGAIASVIATAVLSGLNRWYRDHSKVEESLVQGQRVPAIFADERTCRFVAIRALSYGAGYGALVQILYYWTLGGLNSAGGEVWRWAAWFTLATLIGISCGRLIPVHLPRKEARKGGNWGGAASGFFFSALSTGNGDGAFFGADSLGRLAAAAIIGAWIGYMVVLPLLDTSGIDEEVEVEEIEEIEEKPAPLRLADVLGKLPPLPPEKQPVPIPAPTAPVPVPLPRPVEPVVEQKIVQPLPVEEVHVTEPLPKVQPPPVVEAPPIPTPAPVEPVSAPPVRRVPEPVIKQPEPPIQQNPADWLMIERRIGRKWNARASSLGRRRSIGRRWVVREEADNEVDTEQAE